MTTRILTWLAWRSGLSDIARTLLVSGRRFVLVFHGVSARRRPDLPARAQPCLDAEDLRRVLVWLQQRFRFLTPDEFFHSDRAGVLLTFDDGLANNCTNALPLLEAFCAPAVFFVCTQHVAEPRNWLPTTRAAARRHWPSEGAVPRPTAAEFYDGMSRRQLAQCASGRLVTIGSHTVSHAFLTRIPNTELERELGQSRQFLEEVIGCAVDLFAYPTGDYNRAVAMAVRAAGYRAAFALDPVGVGLPAFEIPRVGIYAAGAAYLSAKLSGLHRRPMKGRLDAASPPVVSGWHHV